MGYFITFVFVILMLISWITLYGGFDLNNIDIINRIEKMIGGEPVAAKRWLIENNKLILKDTQNQVFFIKDKDNIVIKTKNDDNKNIMLSFININNIWKKQEVYQKWTDYQLLKCADSSCRFEKNNDFLIYRFINNTNEVKRINEILIEAINMQKANVSFLKKKADGSVDYNWTAQYILKTWDNNIKFPTVELQPNETIFIKIKIVDENFSI